MRLRTFNRQLVEVGEIGQEINAALPYRETVERALARAKQFLHADFVALILLEPKTRGFDIEGTLGVQAPERERGLLPLHRPTAPCARPSTRSRSCAPTTTRARSSPRR